MSELSRTSGVPIASIKYYQREQLLPPGELSSPTQASYDSSHVERIALVRALLEIGKLSVTTAREVVAAIDDTSLPLTWTFGVAQRAISTKGLEPAHPDDEGTAELAAGLTAAGLAVHDDNPGIPIAVSVLGSMRRLGHEELVAVLPEYIRAAQIVADADLASVAKRAGRTGMAETVVVGTVLGDPLFAALRRIAQEAASRSVFPVPDPDGVEAGHRLFPPAPRD
jgi:DNA-binding transcriptional MerR regulator